METQGGLFEIRIDGTIGPEWADWFDGMEIRCEKSGRTVIVGPVRDQAALRGILDRIADLNLCLVSVHRVDKEEAV